MATELRHEMLVATMAGALVYDNQAEFRNDSAGLIHIRKIRYSYNVTIIGDDQDASWGLTKSPTSTSLNTNNDTHFLLPLSVAGDSTTGPAVVAGQGGDSYGKNQLTLEPGESLFINGVAEATAISIRARFVISYEF